VRERGRGDDTKKRLLPKQANDVVRQELSDCLPSVHLDLNCEVDPAEVLIFLFPIEEVRDKVVDKVDEFLCKN
jgi:hypothetical protein